ncbi:hypothetical protein [Bordetella phage vB_BbrS_PHB09]|nr:hypothetical protein [Bordetella bronchiseptica]QEA10869.1 hypothetical protein [Bordetella phage vB_BbrS_PHB09]
MLTIPQALAWALSFFAVAGLIVGPLGDYIARRHAASDPWKPKCEQ